MGANTTNALYFLVSSVLDVVLWIWMLRILLQLVRADFYNPVSQIVWRFTRFPSDAIRRVIPPIRNFDIASALILFLLSMIYIQIVSSILGLGVGAVSSVVFGLLKLMVLLVNLWTFTLFIQAIMSWLGPGVNNPASNILWSLNEPLLRPVRRIIPTMSGLDLSPLAVMLVLQVISRLIPIPAIFR